jgi:hypothetical protein
MKRILVLVHVGLLAMSAFVACSDSGTTPSDNPNKVFNPFDMDGAADIAAWMSASVTDNHWFSYTTESRQSTVDTTIEDYRECRALFLNKTFDRVMPADVRFEDARLRPSSGREFHVFDATGELPFSMDGAGYTWFITGSVDFPTFSVSIKAPEAKVRITSHAVCDAVIKSRGTRVTWEPEGKSDYVVMIGVSSTDLRAKTPVYHLAATTDDGSYTIPASVFSGLEDQKFTLSVSRGRYSIGYLPDGRKYLVSMYSECNVDLRLVDR